MLFSERELNFQGLEKPLGGYTSWAFSWKAAGDGSRVLTRRPGARFADGVDWPPELYGEFAAFSTSLHDHSIVLFANKYGELGLSALGGEVREAKTLDDWIRHIQWAARLLRLWTAAKDADAPTLRRLVRWRAGGPEVDGEALRPSPTEADGSFPSKGDSAAAALLYVTRALNGQLTHLVSVRAAFDSSRKSAYLEAAPKSLWGAICYTFARAVGSDRTYRQCVGCWRWWETRAGEGRSDKRSCSAACRVKSYRKRRQEARELIAAGKTPRQVAAQLDVDVDVLKGWIKTKRGM